MPAKAPIQLGRRERQIMDAVYQLGEATVAEVLDQLADPPSYSAVRAMLGLLEQKGYLKHRQVKLRFIYMPTVAREQARTPALLHLLRTFFGGSPTQVVSALLGSADCELTQQELAQLADMIEKARRRGQ